MTRAEAIKILSNRDGHGLPSGYNSGYAEAIDLAIEALKTEPIKHGRWIDCKGSNGKDYRKCSECLHTQDITGLLNYCPICGANMDLDEVEE